MSYELGCESVGVLAPSLIPLFPYSLIPLLPYSLIPLKTKKPHIAVRLTNPPSLKLGGCNKRSAYARRYSGQVGNDLLSRVLS
jgi:hypothetical protein